MDYPQVDAVSVRFPTRDQRSIGPLRTQRSAWLLESCPAARRVVQRTCNATIEHAPIVGPRGRPSSRSSLIPFALIVSHPIVDKINQSLADLVTLQIITVVGEVDLSSAATASGKAARTRISLLDGDITTELDPSFVGGEYDAVRQFHLAREEQGQQIIQANIATLTKLLELARDLATPSSGEGPQEPPQ